MGWGEIKSLFLDLTKFEMLVRHPGDVGEAFGVQNLAGWRFKLGAFSIWLVFKAMRLGKIT